MRIALFGIAIAMALIVRPAFGDDRDIVVVTPGERSQHNVIAIGSVAGASVLFGAIGAYFNLDSRDAANAVSAHNFTHQPWTQTKQDLYDRAGSSKVKAEVFYGIGGALLIGAVVALFVTDPRSDKTVIHPHRGNGPMPTVLPAPGGGAMVGGMWSF